MSYTEFFKRFYFTACFIFLGTVFGKEHVVERLSPFNDDVKGNCTCGGFPTSTPDANITPLLSQSPGLVVNCDEEGESTCKSLCLALATATKAKGPEILCYRLKNADDLKLSAFYKTCEKPWSYAGMTADEALCCENSKVKACTPAEAVGTTLTVGI